MSAYYVTGPNKQGINVRLDRAQPPIIEAAQRFAAHVETKIIDDEQHRIWKASRRFRISDDLVTTPERAALILSGYEPALGVSPKVTCGVAGCVALSHLEVE